MLKISIKKKKKSGGVSTRDLIAFLNGKTIPDKTLIKARSSSQKPNEKQKKVAATPTTNLPRWTLH